MRSFTKRLQVTTKKSIELVNITPRISSAISESKIRDGFVVVFSVHTTTAVLVNEDEPNLIADLEASAKGLVPWQEKYRHNLLDGNAPSHITAAFLGVSSTFLVEEGELILGTWQSIFLLELDGPRSRRVLIKVAGD
jgi:secondary thiamine-phosphate synthase enzyme